MSGTGKVRYGGTGVGVGVRLGGGVGIDQGLAGDVGVPPRAARCVFPVRVYHINFSLVFPAVSTGTIAIRNKAMIASITPSPIGVGMFSSHLVGGCKTSSAWVTVSLPACCILSMAVPSSC